MLLQLDLAGSQKPTGKHLNDVDHDGAELMLRLSEACHCNACTSAMDCSYSWQGHGILLACGQMMMLLLN